MTIFATEMCANRLYNYKIMKAIPFETYKQALAKNILESND